MTEKPEIVASLVTRIRNALDGRPDTMQAVKAGLKNSGWAHGAVEEAARIVEGEANGQ